MSKKTLKLKISTLVCKDCGTVNSQIQRAASNSYTIPILFVGQKCSHFCLYWLDSFYDEKLRERYLNKTMICPKCHMSKLTEIEPFKPFEAELKCSKCCSMNLFVLNEETIDLDNISEN